MFCLALVVMKTVAGAAASMRVSTSCPDEKRRTNIRHWLLCLLSDWRLFRSMPAEYRQKEEHFEELFSRDLSPSLRWRIGHGTNGMGVLHCFCCCFFRSASPRLILRFLLHCSLFFFLF
jgi:hypothetical protein